MASATYNSLAADVSLNPDGGFSLFRINLHLFVVPTTNNISNHYRQFQPRRRFFSLSQKREKVRGKKRERLGFGYGESGDAVRAEKRSTRTQQLGLARKSGVLFRLPLQRDHLILPLCGLAQAPPRQPKTYSSVPQQIPPLPRIFARPCAELKNTLIL